MQTPSPNAVVANSKPELWKQVVVENQRRIRMELGRQRTLAAARDLQRAARSLLTRMYMPYILNPRPCHTP